ncbi:MAG: hypothetical protein QG635_1301, partial [Bacteroidota bacterium]|nr:hypothetical protein [Bacteroidota bacterium]
SCDGFWEYYVTNDTFVFSNHWQYILGYSYDDFRQSMSMFEQQIHPSDREITIELFSEHLNRTSSRFEAQFRMKAKDGNWRWLECYGKAVEFDELGKPSKIVGTVTNISFKKESEENAIERNELFERFLLKTNDGIIIFDDKGSIIEWNKSIERITGINQQHAIGKPFWELQFYLLEQGIKNKTILEQNKVMILEFLRTGDTSWFIEDKEYQIKRRDQSYKFIKIQANKINTSKGSKGIVFIKDISDFKQKEKLLKDNESLYRLLADNIADVIWVCDFNLNVKYFSPSIYNMFGYTPEEAIDAGIAKLLTPKSLKIAEEYLKKHITQEFHNNSSGSSREEIEIVCKNGKIIDVEVLASFQRNDEGKPIGIIGVARDITIRKQIENNLEENRRKLYTLISNLPGMAYRCKNDNNWTVEFISDGCKDITGYEPIDFIGNNKLSYASVIHIEDRQQVYDDVQKALNSRTYFRITYRIITRENIEKWVWEQGRGIYSSHGKVIAIEGFIIDVTKNRNYETELTNAIRDIKESKRIIEEDSNKILALNYKLIESEKKLKELNNHKDKFFGIIAHDLRSPLCGFMGLSQMLAKDFLEINLYELQKMVNGMYHSARNLLNLLENLLEWSKIQQGLMEYHPIDFELKKEVDKAIAQFAINIKQKGIEIINKVEEKIFIFADINMFGSILRNLISNAIKFSGSEGLIIISAGIIDGKNIELNVIDNGVGMIKEIVDKLFKIGENITSLGTADEKGTGLGLILCKELVELNKGKIWVKSSPGKGSTFRFTMPATAETILL